MLVKCQDEKFYPDLSIRATIILEGCMVIFSLSISLKLVSMSPNHARILGGDFTYQSRGKGDTRIFPLNVLGCYISLMSWLLSLFSPALTISSSPPPPTTYRRRPFPILLSLHLCLLPRLYLPWSEAGLLQP